MALTVNLSNGTHLEAELFSHTLTSDADVHNLAIFLHPWSWLGGRMNDPVLSLLMNVFEGKKFHMMRYNSRGVGRSSGWASLTGIGEGEDLHGLVGWALEHIKNVRRLVIVGYSYGSLITTLCPPTVAPSIAVSYILVSYPVGPRSWLTLFRSSTYDNALRSIMESGASVLLVFGTEDEFTSAETYERWTSNFRIFEHAQIERVDGGSHFWRGSSGRTLVSIVERWIERPR